MSLVPILKYRDVLLSSIQVELSDDAALSFQEELLQRVYDVGATGVVIDITALDVVDSYLARILNETAQMVGLLGAKAVLCGMRPAVAITLTEMGRPLVGVRTALDLEQGLDALLAGGDRG